MLWFWWLACEAPTDAPVEPLHLEPVVGNPLVPRLPLYPWPSDLYLEADPTTVTGRRIRVPQELLPNDIGAELLSVDDGFTRAPAILTWLDGGIDPASLPTLPGSIGDDSPIWLLEVGTGRRVPVLAEVDLNASDPASQALIVRPQDTLAENTGYVVVLRESLRSLDGGAPPTEDAFRALRDGLVTDDPTVEAMRPGFQLVLDAIDGQDLARDEVVLAWSFHTRSEQAVVQPLLRMHDLAAQAALADWVPVSDTHDGANRLIEGTFLAPDFLGPDGRIALDADGWPIVHGEREVEFLLTLPDTVDQTRTGMLFGHGFFSDRTEPTWGSLQQLIQPWRIPTLSVDFLGFNEDDLLDTIGALSGDLVGLQRVVDQQRQTHTHFTLLSRLVKEQLAGDLVEDRGAGEFHPLSDAGVNYLGISNGGTQGSVLLAASPELTRGVLVVPGGAWSHMLQRAVDWNTSGQIYQLKYPDPLELQLVLAMVQQLLDPVDVVNYARGLVDEPYEGRTRPEFTMHMAVGDCQVSNMVTEWVARSAHVPLVTPSPREIWGLETVTAPPPGRTDLPAALFVYDEGYPPVAEGNLPPLTDNRAHATIRDLPVYLEQVGTWLETGAVVQVCAGACDPD